MKANEYNVDTNNSVNFQKKDEFIQFYNEIDINQNENNSGENATTNNSKYNGLIKVIFLLINNSSLLNSTMNSKKSTKQLASKKAIITFHS